MLRRWFWLPAVLCAAGGCLVAQADGPCSVGMPRLANTFFTDEPVRMSVTLDAPRQTVRYRVRDERRRLREEGFLNVGRAQPVVFGLTRSPGPGYYELNLVWKDGTHQESFCVLPRPYEDPGDYGLFGLSPNNGSTDENLQAAAQMGVRLVRQTVPWPPFEPQPGVWRMDLLDNWHALAQRHGIQMLLILGYTPQFLGEKPVNNLDDWVNNAAFIWHMREPEAYARYLDRVTGFAQGKRVSWPSRAVLPEVAPPAQQSLAWAHGWEMWNEADLMFYVGDWNRYLDLLRVSWAGGRQRLPQARMVYGGSTGNFIAMGQVASGAAKYCFDYANLHTGGDVEEALRVWYSGAQQIPWCVGAPRETSHTECYAQGRRGTCDYTTYRETPGQLLRCYLTLKAWREAEFYRSGCLGGYLYEEGMMAPGTALLVRRAGKLQPTPLYPAFAAARKLLSDAVEVGPADLGPGVTAHVFLKHGRVMLATWSDDRATATIKTTRSARRLDAYGRASACGGGTRLTARLGPEPLVLMGADNCYLSEAIRRRFDLLTQTPYGTLQTNAQCYVWYVNPMMAELQELVGTAAPQEFDRAVRRAARVCQEQPEHGPLMLAKAQTACMDLQRRVVATCPPGREVPVKAANNIWRLVKIDEWLGEIADDRSGLWDNLEASGANVTRARDLPQRVRGEITSRHGAGELPLAGHLLDRAQWQQWRLNQYRRRGTCTAITHKAQLAAELNAIEQGFVLRVVPVVDFPTGRSFRKARVFEPGRAHTLTVWAFNYLDHPVQGTLTLKLPAGWSPAETQVPFSAAVGSPSAPTPVTVTLPADPTPWVQASSFTMDGLINVSLPGTLADTPTLQVEGSLSTGEALCPMTYFVNVGRWLDDPAPAGEVSTAAARAADNARLALPPAVKAAQAQSVLRELQQLAQPPRWRRASSR